MRAARPRSPAPSRPSLAFRVARAARWPRPFGIFVAALLAGLAASLSRPFLALVVVLWALLAAAMMLDARLRDRHGLAGLAAAVGGPFVAMLVARARRSDMRKVQARFRHATPLAVVCAALGGAVAYAAGRYGLDRVAFAARVSSDAMAPKLGDGDLVVVAPLGKGTPRAGDVVAISGDFAGARALRRHGRVIAVLRVVGIGGQWIGAGPDHRVYVCVRAPDILQPLGPEQGCLFPDESPYVAQQTPAFGPVKVPAGTVFLLGDSRRLLDDSRTFGPVPLHAVVGPVVATLWPPSRFGLR